MIILSQILGVMLLLSIILTIDFFITKGAEPKIEFKKSDEKEESFNERSV